MPPSMTHNEEGIESTTARLPALFVRSPNVCLPIKALLFKISFNHMLSAVRSEFVSPKFAHTLSEAIYNSCYVCCHCAI